MISTNRHLRDDHLSSLGNSSTPSNYPFGMTHDSSVKGENLEMRPARRYASDPMSELIKQRRIIEHVVLSCNCCQLFLFRWLCHHSAAVNTNHRTCRNLFDPSIKPIYLNYLYSIRQVYFSFPRKIHRKIYRKSTISIKNMSENVFI